jgi:chlorobactene glucosyltransferase
MNEPPFVSVMIPARNESAVIGQTIRHLMRQSYPHYEVILLDDNSTDGTAEAAAQHGDDERLRIMRGAALPEGWMGKNWACHQMSQTAKGDILVFTDADVQWAPEALSSLVSAMQSTRADLYTVWPTQHTVTWAERLCVPLMAVVVIGYLPVIGTHYVPLSVFGAANGQCMAWRRHAYQLTCGHEAVFDNVLEDVTLARMVKGAGLRLRMADGNHLISCRMYNDWRSVRDGYAKNILAGYGNSVLALVLATIFHWLIFLFPWVWLGFGWTVDALSIGWPAWPLALIVIGLTIRALTAAFTHQRVLDALLLPVSVLLMTRIAFQAIWWELRYGGPTWKGRVVRRNKAARKQEMVQEVAHE